VPLFSLKIPPGSEAEISEQKGGKSMKVKVIVDKKRVFDLDDVKDFKEITSSSLEGFSFFTVRYEPDQNTLYVEYGAEWPWLHINGRDERLF